MATFPDMPRTPRLPSRAKPEKRLLIIECDAAKLAAQGLNIATRAEAACAHFVEVDRIQATTRAETLRALGEYAQGRRRPRFVLVVGHSNENGIQLAADAFIAWKEFAAWLAPFKPDTLLLLACRAGRWSDAVVPLFDNIPSLRRLFASPAPLNEMQAALGILLPDLLTRRTSAEKLRTGLLVNTVVTRSGFKLVTRSEYLQTDPDEDFFRDVVDHLVEAALRGRR